MKNLLLLSLTCAAAFSSHAADHKELVSLVSENRSSATPKSTRELQCYCFPPYTTITARREYENKFDTIFHPDGPWTKQGNPVKKFCVEYLRKVGTNTCFITGFVPAAAILCLLCSSACAPCCFNNVPCAPALSALFPCKSLDDPITLRIAASVFCPLLSPPSGACADICCIECLADPNNWTAAETSYQSISQPDKESN